MTNSEANGLGSERGPEEVSPAHVTVNTHNCEIVDNFVSFVESQHRITLSLGASLK